MIEPRCREIIARYGLMVVEGFNDVVGLDSIGIPAVGLTSNKITEGQIQKIERFAKRLSNGKVVLLFEVDEGAKEAAWKLLPRRLDVRLA